MFLDVKDLAVRKQRIHKRYGPGAIDYESSEARQVGSLEVNATAELIDGQIRVEGHLETKIEMTCARCLEPVVEGRRIGHRLFRGRRHFSRGRAERTGAARAAYEGDLPERLPGALPQLRRQPQS